MSKAHTYDAIPSRILVPIDFSSSSHAALDTAAELAEKFHASIHLLHVIPAFPNPSIPDVFAEVEVTDVARKQAEERFDSALATLAEKGIQASSSIEVGNNIADVVLRVIEHHHIDLVVISTHGLSGWYPLVFGSTAEKIIKLVPCPVLLLRTPKPDGSD